VEPLVAWIWVGGFIVFVGAAIAFTYRGPKGRQAQAEGPRKPGQARRPARELVTEEVSA
jgi:uncharacterized BrkB/YihY/UPF0761 family membrane protein